MSGELRDIASGKKGWMARRRGSHSACDMVSRLSPITALSSCDTEVSPRSARESVRLSRSCAPCGEQMSTTGGITQRGASTMRVTGPPQPVVPATRF
jgi:hypothetical protein